MHESSNKVISTRWGRLRSHAERNSLSNQILDTYLKAWISYFRLQTVLYLAKCTLMFDPFTAAAVAFPQVHLKQGKKKSARVSRNK